MSPIHPSFIRGPVVGDRRKRRARLTPPAVAVITRRGSCVVPRYRSFFSSVGGEDVTFADDMIRLLGNALCVDTSQVFAGCLGRVRRRPPARPRGRVRRL
jgi:hypothetical protein